VGDEASDGGLQDNRQRASGRAGGPAPPAAATAAGETAASLAARGVPSGRS